MPSSSTLAYGVRSLREHPDVDQLRAELVAIEEQVTGLPWSEAMFGSELLRPDGIQLGAWPAAKPQLVGFLFAAPLGGAWHVMNVAVHPQHQARGLGSRLLQAAIRLAAGRDPAGYTLEVRAQNLPAQRLYRAYGFRPRGVRPGYYPDTGEDALIMWRPPQAVLDAGTDPDAWEPLL